MNDIQSLKVILEVVGAFLSFLLVIIGFWLKNFINATNNLKDTVDSLRTIVEVLKVNHTNIEANLSQFQEVSTHRLNDHADRLDKHEKQLVSLHAKINYQRRIH